MNKNNYNLGANMQLIATLNDAFTSIFKDEYNVNFESRQDINLNSGKCNYREKWAYIGERGIAEKNPTKVLEALKNTRIKTHIKSKTPITDLAVVLYATSGFHELQHCYQDKYKFQQKFESNDEESQYTTLMAIQDYANRNNTLHYINNYQFNLSEFDAEFYGFVNGYQYLRTIYSENISALDAAFLNAYNYKASQTGHWLHSEILHGTFKTIQELENAFESTRLRLCDPKYAVQNISKLKISDVVIKDGELKVAYNAVVAKANEFSQYSDIWASVYQQLMSAEGYDIDKKLAAISNVIYPEEILNYSLLKNVDISTKTIFGTDIQPPIQQPVTAQTSTQKRIQEDYIPKDLDLQNWLHEQPSNDKDNDQEHLVKQHNREEDDGQPSL